MKVAISAGEASGDEHAAALIAAMKSINASCVFRGMGGTQLKAGGLEVVVDASTDAGLMGFFPVLASLRRIHNSLQAMRRMLKEWAPDLLILVDYPDFNLRLARQAKQLGIPTFYYIPPKMWAWRASRIKQFHRFIDRTALIFPFEKSFFKSHQYANAFYVGHPFASQFTDPPANHAAKAAFCLAHGINPDSHIVAILPGSRSAEVKKLLPLSLEALKLLNARVPNVVGVIAVADSISAEWINSQVPPQSPVVVVKGATKDVLKNARVGLLKSGTSNLQAAFLHLPFVMYYQASALSAFIAKRLVSLKEYSPVNIIRPGTVPELLQKEVNPRRIADELAKILSSVTLQKEMIQGLQEVQNCLMAFDEHALFKGTNSAAERAARLAIDLVKKPTQA
jgi:lipid-A-disaccharide synthase